jgi:short-subunit dehydrogenase
MARPGQEENAEPLVIVTGASGGMGIALAERLARPGLTLGLVGRNTDGLERACAAARARGASAIASRLDVTDTAFEDWVAQMAGRHTLAGLYANAGLSAGPPCASELETADDTDRLVRTNLFGTINTVRAVVGAMRRQGAARRRLRRIGIVASIAGLFPTPDLAVYSATKAGLVAYAHALRPRLAGAGIAVTVVCPGFVTSPMSDRHKGAKPFEMTAQAAARRIVAAVEGGRRTAVFPLPFALLSLVAPLAPGPLVDRVVPAFRAEIMPDPRNEPRPARPRDRSAD